MPDPDEFGIAQRRPVTAPSARGAVISLVATISFIIAAGSIIFGTSRANASRQLGRGEMAALPGFVLAAMGTLVCLGIVVLAIVAMIHKPS